MDTQCKRYVIRDRTVQRCINPADTDGLCTAHITAAKEEQEERLQQLREQKARNARLEQERKARYDRIDAAVQRLDRLGIGIYQDDHMGIVIDVADAETFANLLEATRKDT